MLYRDQRTVGLLHATLGTVIGAASGQLVSSPLIAGSLSVAGRQLWQCARTVADELEAGDLAQARLLVRALVGRDTSELDVTDLSRAAVESVAENTVDAIIAPMLWTALLGAPGAFGYRAVNTMDAMVGHRTDRYSRFGWASARVDDVANYVPARWSALCVLAVRPQRRTEIRRAWREDASLHPSPNAGVIEAAFAGALGLRLGGPNVYHGVSDERPVLGIGRVAEPRDIGSAIGLSQAVTSLTAGFLVSVAAVDWARGRNGVNKLRTNE